MVLFLWRLYACVLLSSDHFPIFPTTRVYVVMGIIRNLVLVSRADDVISRCDDVIFKQA